MRLHKENVCVPLNEGRHKDLTEFKSHVMSFTGIKTVAAQKRICGGKALTQILPVYQRIAKVAKMSSQIVYKISAKLA